MFPRVARVAPELSENFSLAFNTKGITKDSDEESEVKMVLSTGSSFSWELHAPQLASAHAYKSEVM